MRKLARLGGKLWIVIAAIPGALLANVILSNAGWESSQIVPIQLPLLALQLFGMFVMIRYRREIF